MILRVHLSMMELRITVARSHAQPLVTRIPRRQAAYNCRPNVSQPRLTDNNLSDGGKMSKRLRQVASLTRMGQQMPTLYRSGHK